MRDAQYVSRPAIFILGGAQSLMGTVMKIVASRQILATRCLEVQLLGEVELLGPMRVPSPTAPPYFHPWWRARRSWALFWK